MKRLENASQYHLSFLLLITFSSAFVFFVRSLCSLREIKSFARRFYQSVQKLRASAATT